MSGTHRPTVLPTATRPSSRRPNSRAGTRPPGWPPGYPVVPELPKPGSMPIGPNDLGKTFVSTFGTLRPLWAVAPVVVLTAILVGTLGTAIARLAPTIGARMDGVDSVSDITWLIGLLAGLAPGIISATLNLGESLTTVPIGGRAVYVVAYTIYFTVVVGLCQVAVMVQTICQTVLYTDARIRDEGLAPAILDHAANGSPADPWVRWHERY